MEWKVFASTKKDKESELLGIMYHNNNFSCVLNAGVDVSDLRETCHALSLSLKWQMRRGINILYF